MSFIHNHLLPVKLWAVDDSNELMKIKLERDNIVPTSSAIRQNLGPKLADAIISQVCPTTKTLMGLGKELDGPGEETWTQPERHLLGEIILEPYPTRRHRQALSHQSILEYGQKCMEQWEDEVTSKMDAALKEKIRYLEEEMAEQMDIKINQVKTKEREDFLTRIAMMEQRLAEKHEKEMEVLQRKLQEEKDVKVAEVIDTLNKSHKHETESLLTASQQLLTNRFHFRLNWIKTDLEQDYENRLRIETKMLENKLKNTSDPNKAIDVDALKDEIFQKVLCTACLAAELLTKQFQENEMLLRSEISKLNDQNTSLLNGIKELEEKNNLCIKEVQAWECVVQDLVKEFQKFIEFQLKLSKEETMFLISLEKVIERKDQIIKQLLGKSLEEKPELSVKPEIVTHEKRESSPSFAEICGNKDVISIISSIIRRVIPSQTSLVDSKHSKDYLLEDIVRKVIPSTTSFSIDKTSKTNIKYKSSLICSEGPIKYCPKSERQENVSISRVSKEPKTGSSPAVTKDYNEQLNNRITEIIKILNEHPNIMKYITEA